MKRPSPLFLFTSLVVVSLGVALAGLSWRLMGYDVSAYAPPPPSRGEAGEQGEADGEAIFALAPFGRMDAGDAPATRLPLVLQGIMLTEPREASTVLVKSGNEPALSYGVGDVLPGGARLEVVHADHVLLQVGGRTERLSFPQPPAVPVDNQAGPSGAPVPPQPSEPASPQPGAVPVLQPSAKD